ncbi:MAG: hypothetical protein NXI20_27120 [bacterium]|nr:hypothetical protein [bacterium]
MKTKITILFCLVLSYYSNGQITEQNGLPTGMTIQNPTNSSNSYYNVDLTVNSDNGRAAGGLSIGLDGDVHQRYWLYHSYYDNNQFVGKFHINYGTNKFFTIQSNGNIGVGTTNPSSKFAVEHGDFHLGKETSSNGQRRYARIYGYDANAQFYGTIHSNWEDLRRTFDIYTSSTTQQLKIDASANASGRIVLLPGSSAGVGIGTISTGSHKLAVEGSIGAREVKVEANGWSDFVFLDDYELPSLKEVESYIEEEGHLPNIPKEEEILENGINLGEMDSKLLQKIEELTLYLIEQNKQLEVANAQIRKLTSEVEVLKQK